MKHSQLFETLQNIIIDYKGFRVVRNLCWNQTTRLKIGSSSILSKFSKEALEETNEGIKINGEWTNNIRYAVDTVVLSNSIDGLQYLIGRVQRTSAERGLGLNPNKTKWMLVSETQKPTRKIENEQSTNSTRGLIHVSRNSSQLRIESTKPNTGHT